MSSIAYKQDADRTTDFLFDYQLDAVNRLDSGKILYGTVGSGKSLTSLFWYFKECGGWITKDTYTPMKHPKNLVIITTAKKIQTKEWLGELAKLALYPDENGKTRFGNTITLNSWNQIHKYEEVKDAIFILDEQRLVSYGSWTKSFLKIAKNNKWILLSGTPGDTYMDYMPIFLANGFYRNKTEFIQEHVRYARYSKFPKIEGYMNTQRLDRLRSRVLVEMEYHHDIKLTNIDIWCDFDKQLFKKVIKDRWDIYKDEPIVQASSLCYVLRRIVNTDPSRLAEVLQLTKKHPKVIIFYNFTYELNLLRQLDYGDDVEVAEYNGEKHQDIPTGSKWVYLCQYTAAAEGWSCIKTDAMILYSKNYSYKIMTQAAGRTNRLNTPYDELFYYHLKSRSGIDLSISKALSQKKKFNEKRFAGFDK